MKLKFRDRLARFILLSRLNQINKSKSYAAQVCINTCAKLQSRKIHLYGFEDEGRYNIH